MVATIQQITKRFTRKDFPAKDEIHRFIQQMASFMFPIIDGGGSQFAPQWLLQKRLAKLLKPLSVSTTASPKLLAANFFSSIQSIKKSLEEDAQFIAQNDPAAQNADEVVLAYPGFFAILVYRMAHQLHMQGVLLIPRIMTEYAHSITGIDIHPGATIGSNFCIDHGTGVVIGETAIIGNRVKLYQGVTIGALSVSKEIAKTKRHPTIENDVIVYAGSTILGGNTTIGASSTIGGNVWLTHSVPPYSLVYHESKVVVKEGRLENNRERETTKH